MSLRGPDENQGRAGSGGAVPFADAARKAGSSIAWGLVLVVFMRLLAVAWVIQGLIQWAGVLLPQEALFDQVTMAFGAAVIFFAVFDLVAAVGLWLASPWGGAIWLFVALAQILVTIAIPGFFSTAWISADILLIALYFFLTWQAGHSAPPRSGAE